MAALERSLEEAQGRRADPDDDGDGALESLSRDELYERAQKAGVSGRSSMSKRELVDALSG